MAVWLLDSSESPIADLGQDKLDWLDRHSNVLYPVLAVAVLVLIVLGILQAWRAQEVDGLSKVELKRQIVHELRKQLGGASAEELAKVLGLDGFKTVKLLEQMQKDGLLTSHTNTARRTVWRLKGLGG